MLPRDASGGTHLKKRHVDAGIVEPRTWSARERFLTTKTEATADPLRRRNGVLWFCAVFQHVAEDGFRRTLVKKPAAERCVNNGRRRLISSACK